MKKLSPRRKRYLVKKSTRVSARRRNRQAIRNEKFKKFKAGYQRYSYLRSTAENTPAGYIPVVLPANFSLVDNFEESVACLNLMRELALKSSVPFFLHMHAMEHMEPGAAVALFSECYRCRNLPQRYSTIRRITGSYSQNPVILDMLYQMGFYRLLGVVDPPSESYKQGERYFSKLVTFKNRVDALSISRFRNEIAEAFALSDNFTRQRMQGGIIEAINNTIEHAYRTSPRYAAMTNRSWTSTIIDPQRSQFTLNVFDQGVGIPATLDRTAMETAKRIALLGTGRDSSLIHAATTLHRTSTHQRGRGKGFMTIKRLVDTCVDGELRVYSNRGLHIYDGQDQPVGKDFNEHLGGTLIQW